MRISIPENVKTALDLIERNGYSAYIVGGCVRDCAMGKEPHDWDMTTSSPPGETERIFSSFRVIPTGIKHGTVTVIIDGTQIEITTMRTDGDYLDSRHPENVSFTDDINEDLSRRDFTINAIAYNPASGAIDPFGGLEDIKNRRIKCVGDPDRRFGEDALRVLRAIRFSSVLDFEIEEKTAGSVIRNRALLKNISAERKRDELGKLLCGKNVEDVLTKYSEVIFTVIPELEALDGFDQRTPYHIYDIWLHTVKVVSAIKNTRELKVAALLHDIGKPDKFTVDENGCGHFKGHPEVSERMSREILGRLKFSNEEIMTICLAVRYHDLRPDGTKRQLVKWCSKYGMDNIRNAVEIMKADAAAQNPDFFEKRNELYRKTDLILDEIKDRKLCLTLKELRVDGNDMAAMGLSGRDIGAALEFLLDSVLDGKLDNDRKKLLSAAESEFRSKLK